MNKSRGLSTGFGFKGAAFGASHFVLRPHKQGSLLRLPGFRLR